MHVTLSWQTVITAAAVVGAIVALVTYFAKLVRWVDKQKKQDIEIQELKAVHENDITDTKRELTILVYGVLACLKGLREQGCNDSVPKAIHMIEKHLNQEAHK